MREFSKKVYNTLEFNYYFAGGKGLNDKKFHNVHLCKSFHRNCFHQTIIVKKFIIFCTHVIMSKTGSLKFLATVKFFEVL